MCCPPNFYPQGGALKIPPSCATLLKITASRPCKSLLGCDTLPSGREGPSPLYKGKGVQDKNEDGSCKERVAPRPPPPPSVRALTFLLDPRKLPPPPSPRFFLVYKLPTNSFPPTPPLFLALPSSRRIFAPPPHRIAHVHWHGSVHVAVRALHIGLLPLHLYALCVSHLPLARFTEHPHRGTTLPLPAAVLSTRIKLCWSACV